MSIEIIVISAEGYCGPVQCRTGREGRGSAAGEPRPGSVDSMSLPNIGEFQQEVVGGAEPGCRRALQVRKATERAVIG